MEISVVKPHSKDIFALRALRRKEMNCQIVHDSIHRRKGWTQTFQFSTDGDLIGFGSIAIDGPWKDRTTAFEFYVIPKRRNCIFEVFEIFIEASRTRFLEVQSNDTLLTAMLHTYARDIQSEKIIFEDQLTTHMVLSNALLIPSIANNQLQNFIENRSGGPEWHLVLKDQTIGSGGLLFHYNRPYCDLYMEIFPTFRNKGHGSYLVQELKKIAYQLMSVPCARCNPSNIASRKALQKSGFIPCAHLLKGSL